MANRFSISEEQKRQFAGIYLLEYMINTPKHFQLMLAKEEEDLEPILEWLLVRDCLEIRNQEKYVPNENGRKALKRFMVRYSDFLNFFDVYSAVDLAAGEFAFASYFDFNDDSEWKNFLQEDRWEDLRVAVADFKGMDPVEIVFMSFLDEGRFGRSHTGWQFDLLLGTVWDDILEICDKAVQVGQLGYEAEGESIPGEDVIRDVIIQGAELVFELHSQEAGLARAIHHDGRNGTPHDSVDPPEHDADYYQSYQDPEFVPPHWRTRWEL